MSDSPQKQEKKRGGRNPPEAHRFKKGQSGNPGGRPKGSISIAAKLRQAFTEGIEVDGRKIGGEELLHMMAKSGIRSSLKGDYRFWKEILDRIDGKPEDVVRNDGKMEVVIRYVDRPIDHADGNS